MAVCAVRIDADAWVLGLGGRLARLDSLCIVLMAVMPKVLGGLASFVLANASGHRPGPLERHGYQQKYDYKATHGLEFSLQRSRRDQNKFHKARWAVPEEVIENS